MNRSTRILYLPLLLRLRFLAGSVDAHPVTLLARITDKLTMFLFQSTVVPSLSRYRDTVCLVLLRYVDFRLKISLFLVLGEVNRLGWPTVQIRITGVTSYRPAPLSPMAALQNYFLTWKIGNPTRLGTSSSLQWHYRLGLRHGWPPEGTWCTIQKYHSMPMFLNLFSWYS